MPSTVRIRFYATARQAAGRPELDWEIPSDGLPARELVRALAARFPQLRSILTASRFLRNDRYLSSLAETIAPGDVFAVHPPYGGG